MVGDPLEDQVIQKIVDQERKYQPKLNLKTTFDFIQPFLDRMYRILGCIMRKWDYEGLGMMVHNSFKIDKAKGKWSLPCCITGTKKFVMRDLQSYGDVGNLDRVLDEVDSILSVIQCTFSSRKQKIRITSIAGDSNVTDGDSGRLHHGDSPLCHPCHHSHSHEEVFCGSSQH